MATEWDSRSDIKPDTSPAKEQDHLTSPSPTSRASRQGNFLHRASGWEKRKSAGYAPGDFLSLESEEALVNTTPKNEAEIRHDRGEGKWYEATIQWDEAKLRTRTQKGLGDYLQKFFVKQPMIKDIASVLIPGAVAAFLFPVFGPVVAAGAAAVAVQNGLKLLGISLSSHTTEAFLKPFENRPLDGSDVQSILEDTLKNLLPSDEQVNKDVTEVVEEKIIPEIKVVALEQLRSSLEVYFEKQSWSMAERAVELSKLIEC